MISIEEAKVALLGSGYLLETRIETLLRRRGYYVEANAAYPDPETGKSREYDLWALTTAGLPGPDELEYLFTHLLIECINNPEPLVLITKTPFVPMLQHEHLKHAGIPIRFPDKKRGYVGLTEYLQLHRYHHYCKGRIATQYCSFQQKQKGNQKYQWMASHDDMHFAVFKKLCSITDHALAQYYRTIRLSKREVVNIEICYPMLVIQNHLWEARAARRGSLQLIPRQHLRYLRTDYVRGREHQYIIDVVTERHFGRYVSLLENEMKRMARVLRRRHSEVLAALRLILPKARRARTPDKRRKAMEP